MTPETPPSSPICEPPAPVMGGMRWSRPFCNPERFWKEWERRKDELERECAEELAWRDHVLARDKLAGETGMPRRYGAIRRSLEPAPDFRRPEESAERTKERKEPPPPSVTITGQAPPPEGRLNEEYTYHARARDAYTTGFTWYFEQSPPGMTVDRHTGRVNWTPTRGGWHEVILCVRTVYGKTAKQTWTVCIRRPAPVRVPRPNPRFSAALRRKRATPRRYDNPFPAPRRAARAPPGARLAAATTTALLTLRL